MIDALAERLLDDIDADDDVVDLRDQRGAWSPFVVPICNLKLFERTYNIVLTWIHQSLMAQRGFLSQSAGAI